MKTYVAALTLSFVLIATLPGIALTSEIEGKAGMGASLGVIKFGGDGDWGDGSARFSGQAVFQYGLTERFAVQFEAGGGWNNNGGENESQGIFDTLTVVFPVTFGLQYRTQIGESGFWPHLGVGGGLYNMGVKDSRRTWAKGTETGEQMTWTGWGGFVKLGTDYFFSDSVSMNFDLVNHYINCNEGNRFGDRFGDENTSMMQFRTGVNYFFHLGSSDEEIEEQLDDTSDEGDQ